MVHMPGGSYKGGFTAQSEEEKLISECLAHHVKILAGEIGERHIWEYDNLMASYNYIKNVFSELGFEPKKQDFTVRDKIVKNLEVEISGSTFKERVFVLGAHYDTVFGSPGANDNASGVAALLEVARLIRDKEFLNTIRLVIFVNEEMPFFKTSEMGSYVYARRCKHRKEQILGMISLEAIGYYSDIKGSQRYPFPLGLLYPQKANFIGFVSNLHSRRLLHKAIKVFRLTTQFPSEGLVAPAWFTGIDWSDQWSFWEFGYPAIMITDTALFRYGPYHSQWDTPKKIDYEKIARVVTGIVKIINELGNNNESF